MSEITDASPAEPDAAAIGFAVLASGMEEAFAAVQAEIAMLSRVLQDSRAAPHAALPSPTQVPAKPQPPDSPARAAPSPSTEAAGSDVVIPARSPPVRAPVEARPGPTAARDTSPQVAVPVRYERVAASAAPMPEAASQPRTTDAWTTLPPVANPPATPTPMQPPDVPTWEPPQPMPSAPLAHGVGDVLTPPEPGGPAELPWVQPSPVASVLTAAVPTPARPMQRPPWPLERPAIPSTPATRAVIAGAEAPWPGSAMAPAWAPMPMPMQMAPVAPDMAPVGPQASASAPDTSMTRNTTHQHHHASDRSAPLHGDVFLDGMRVGHWLAETLAREAGGPAAGSTSFDPRLGPRWPGALQGQ
jgi:hypothetical protein